MTITRREQSEIYSKVVEANGFVFTAGIVPSNLTADVKGQTEEVLTEIMQLTISTRENPELVQASFDVQSILKTNP